VIGPSPGCLQPARASKTSYTMKAGQNARIPRERILNYRPVTFVRGRAGLAISSDRPQSF